MPNGVWRTSTSHRVRGGAATTAFDGEAAADAPHTHARSYTEDELWDNYEYFLSEVLPVAEEAGVTLALHPNDPPVESLGGIPFLFRNFESVKRAVELVPSANHGVEFCLGTWSEMGADPFRAIEFFGERDEIVYVHFRDVNGTVPSFHETFIDDEDSNYDPEKLMAALVDVGFSGMILPDHVPTMENDTDWNHRGRAYTIGLLKGLLRSVK